MIWLEVSPLILDALDNTTFGEQYQKAIATARGELRRRSNGNRMLAVDDELGMSLLRALENCREQKLTGPTRKSLEIKIESLGVEVASYQKYREMFDTPEGAKTEGEVGVWAVSQDHERTVEDLRKIEKWADYDETVREALEPLRESITKLTEALVEFKTKINYHES